MASQASGRTYGFGRVSAATRPSPYSPLHARSRIELPTPPGGQKRPGAPRAHLGSSMLAVLGGAVFGLSAWLWYFDGTKPRPTDAAAPFREPPPLTEEAQRLARSALVHHGLASARIAPTVSVK